MFHQSIRDAFDKTIKKLESFSNNESEVTSYDYIRNYMGLENFYYGDQQDESFNSSRIVLEYFIRKFSNIFIDLTYEFQSYSYAGNEREIFKVYQIDFNKMSELKESHQIDYQSKIHLLKDYEKYIDRLSKDGIEKNKNIHSLIKELNPFNFQMYNIQFIIELNKARENTNTKIFKDIDSYFFYCHPAILASILESIINYQLSKSKTHMDVINEEMVKFRQLERIFTTAYHSRNEIIENLTNENK